MTFVATGFAGAIESACVGGVGEGCVPVSISSVDTCVFCRFRCSPELLPAAAIKPGVSEERRRSGVRFAGGTDFRNPWLTAASLQFTSKTWHTELELGNLQSWSPAEDSPPTTTRTCSINESSCGLAAAPLDWRPRMRPASAGCTAARTFGLLPSPLGGATCRSILKCVGESCVGWRPVKGTGWSECVRFGMLTGGASNCAKYRGATE